MHNYKRGVMHLCACVCVCSTVSDCHSNRSPTQTLRLGASPGVMDKLFC